MFQELEARLLLSADLYPAAQEALLATPALQGAEFRALVEVSVPTVVTSAQVAPIQRTHELVFVDTATPEYQSLMEAMREAARGQGRHVEFVLIDADKDGISKISDTLAQKSDLDAIHVISHASDGAVQLGSTQLDFETLVKRAASVKKWGDALTGSGDILFYGCELAASAEGQSLMQAVARLTGADVAASEDPTGAAAKGGDWNLEFKTGAIEAQIAVSADGQNAWNYTLAEPAYVGNGTLAPGSGTITPALPSGIKPGDLLLAVFESQGGQAVSFTNQNGGTWNLLANPNTNTGGNSTRLTVFWSVYNGTQGDPTTNDPGNHVSGFIAAFRGVNTTTPINITSQSTGNSSAVSIATATTTVADTLVVMVGSSDDDADTFGTWANAGLTSVTDRYQASHAQNSQGTISMATGIRATTGSYAASTSTLSGSSHWAGMTIALAPGRAPVLNAAASPVLNATNEDAGAPSGAVGTLVSSLVDFPGGGGLDNVADADSPALLGIAVTVADTSNGTWFYSVDDGAAWNLLGAVSASSARLLAADASTRIYFQPNPDWNGTLTSAITFRAWDQTSGANGALANSGAGGGTSAFSSAIDTASLTVTPVNDAPNASNLSAAEAYLEDTALNLTDIVVSDVDSANVAVTLTLSDVAAGALNTATSGAVTSTFVGGVWTAAGALADVNTLLAGLTFTPALNYNANFTIATSVSDG
ncbi:MAG TPA: DUF4347 domain-containing protein, partial [Burkholderiales bacterium]|nr:DUF4347 domain-containing protein [Burkholderiales bacterium]